MKAACLHWEFMFTRTMNKTTDMIEQHELLSWVANEIDTKRLRTTVTNRWRTMSFALLRWWPQVDKIELPYSPINAQNRENVHRQIEAGTAKLEIVIEGF